MKTAIDLEAAMAAADRSADELIAVVADRALSGLGVSEILEFAAWVDQLRSKLAVIDHSVVTELEAQNAPDEQLMRSTTHLLAARLRISRGEARRRVEASAVLAPHDLISGVRQPPRYPRLAEAQAEGAVTAESASVIIGCLSAVERLVGLGDVGPDDLDEVEQTLTTQAKLFDPGQLSRCATRILECLDPDGAPDREERHR